MWLLIKTVLDRHARIFTTIKVRRKVIRHAEIALTDTIRAKRFRSDEWFPPKRAQAMARRLVIGRRGRRRRARKAAGFPANNAKWCICQGEFVHRRRRRRRRALLRSDNRSLRNYRRSTEAAARLFRRPALKITFISSTIYR